jgi:hypothetical protein
MAQAQGLSAAAFGKLYNKRRKLTKERAGALYRILNNHQIELERRDPASRISPLVAVSGIKLRLVLTGAL